MYPIVLKELDLHYELWKKCEEINRIFVDQMKKDTEIIDKQQELISNYQEQLELMEKQLKKKKSGWITPAIIGIASGVIVGSLL